MEIVLAIVVVAAVIFFGALISAGNERQRKAIDDLREQTALWAMQDLRIKRERLAREVQVDDPLGWLNRIASRVCGFDMNLQVVEAFDQPQALICASRDQTNKLIFTPLSPNEIHRMTRVKRNRLSSHYMARNPLLSLPRGVTSYELSVLNSDILFGSELPLAWKGLTGQDLGQLERIWVYILTS